MAKKFSDKEKLLDEVSSLAGFTYAEIDVYMRNAMAQFTMGKRTGDQIKMHKGYQGALAASGACIILGKQLQTVARMMAAVSKEK